MNFEFGDIVIFNEDLKNLWIRYMPMLSSFKARWKTAHTNRIRTDEDMIEEMSKHPNVTYRKVV